MQVTSSNGIVVGCCSASGIEMHASSLIFISVRLKSKNYTSLGLDIEKIIPCLLFFCFQKHPCKYLQNALYAQVQDMGVNLRSQKKKRGFL
jgi:hypothetical protein